MKLRWLTRCFPAFSLVIALNASDAQPQHPGEQPEEPRFLFYEAVNLVAADSAHSRVDIHYRIDQSFFIAVKNQDSTFPWPFRRKGDILMELVDSTGISRAREIERIEKGALMAEPSPDEKFWYTGVASFTVSPGEYKITFDVEDLESDRKFLDRERRIRALSFQGHELRASTPLFLSDTSVSAPVLTLVPQNYGGDVLYGSRGTLFLEVSGDTAAAIHPSFEYTINALPASPGDEQTLVLADTVRDLVPITGPLLQPVAGKDSVGYSVDSTPGRPFVGFLIPVPLEKLPLRNLLLNGRIRAGERVVEVHRPFRTLWPNMPLSLRDVDLALDALRYITSESQLDSLKHGSFEERRKNLEGFWSEKSKAGHATALEMMTEYYRRVDHAIREFNTLREPDGWKTDRGRIYILHGPPSHSERILDPRRGYQETWMYDSLHKKFIFVDQNKSGNYVLVSTQNL